MKDHTETPLTSLVVKTITTTLKYQVLHNLPKEAVYKIAEQSEKLGIFTFPVYTCDVSEVEDFQDIPELDYLVLPMWLPDASHIGSYVEQLQKTVFGEEISG